MDTKQMMKNVACVLATLADVGGDSPRSPIYLALGSDMETFEAVENVIVQAGLATRTADTIALTAKGFGMARRINEVLKHA